jgi:chromosomal replication initiator protein
MNTSEVSAPSGLWESILACAERKIGPRACNTWLSPAKIKSLDGGILNLSVPNEFFVEWLSEHYLKSLTEAVSEALGRPVKVALAIDERPVKGGNGGSQVDDAWRAQALCEPPRPLPRDGHLNPSYTFANFIVASNNQLANAACMAVLEKPGTTYNPLFIYGGSGLGKTHMLHAIGHAALAGANTERVFYVSAERFMNEMIFSIQQGTTLAFRDKYRRAELLLIDDVHFLGGKESTQEEFFHTFNSIHDSGRQIVLTCDRPPKEIPRVEERLISRFTWGLVVDIQRPDLETRIAILHQKAARLGFALSQDVAITIANIATANVRELEGSLLRVQAQARLTGTEPTPETVAQLLGEVLRPQHRALTVQEVQSLVAKHFGLQPKDLCGRRRTNNVAFPRQLAMYLCRTYLDVPLAEIGRTFGGRDHTTVLYACAKVDALLTEDPSIKRTLSSLVDHLNRRRDNLFTN